MKLLHGVVLTAFLASLLTAVTPAFTQSWTQRIVPAENDQGTNSRGDVWFLSCVACSANGATIVAGANYGPSDASGAPIYLSTNLGATWQVTSAPYNSWNAVACSADGTKMVAGASMYLYNPLTGGLDLNPSTLSTSSDSGLTWTPQNSAPLAGAEYVDNWVSIASSADGTRLVASVNEYDVDYYGTTNAPGVAGGIYLSADSGASWHAAGGMPTWSTWRAVASSADGNTLAAIGSPLSVANTGPSLYVSIDGGGSWQQATFSIQPVNSVAISGDGRTIIAAGTNIITSTNSGGDWVVQPGTPQGQFGPYHWASLAASADGTKLVAGTSLYTIYASDDSGATWQEPYNIYSDIGWTRLASSADGLELVALPVRSGSGYGTNLDYRDIYTFQTPLVASITATPQSVQLTNTISVVLTVFNNYTNAVTDVSVNGSITVAGTGGVAPAGFSGPTLTAMLAPGASTSFTYLYTATNYGTVNFTASATCMGPGGVVTSPPATSGDVVIAPRADLMVKTADTNDTTFAGEDEFQQPPPYNDQNWTLRVGNNGSAGYVVRLQNDTSTERTFIARTAKLCGVAGV